MRQHTHKTGHWHTQLEVPWSCQRFASCRRKWTSICGLKQTENTYSEAKYWLLWMDDSNFAIRLSQWTYLAELICLLRMNELLVELHSCQGLTSVRFYSRSHTMNPERSLTLTQHINGNVNFQLQARERKTTEIAALWFFLWQQQRWK